MKRTVCLINVLLIAYAGCATLPEAPLESLYTADDGIQILDADNFYDQIADEPYATIVEFYASWCGFCQRFAPLWKAFTEDVLPWQHVLRVAAINCALEKNLEICTSNNITSYPRLLYFDEMKTNATGKPVQKVDDVNLIRSFVIERMIESQAEGKGRIFPNLQPYTRTDLPNDFSEDVEYIFLMMDDGYLAATVALDLHQVKNIRFYYSSTNNTALLKPLNQPNTHFLYVQSKDGTNKTWLDHIETRTELRQTIVDFLVENGVRVEHIPTKIGRKKSEAASDPAITKIKSLGDVVFRADLESVLKYSLKNEVGKVAEISGTKLASLRSYIEALIKYFPLLSDNTFLLEINKTISGDGPIHGRIIKQTVKSAEDAGVFSIPVGKQLWIGCRGSQPDHRGYTCGLWTLFHYLTVNGDDQPQKILRTIHDYVRDFFGCEDCSNHFQEMAARRNLTQAQDAVVWLWEAHNEVNQRLAGDFAEDPVFPKQQFPSNTHCPECRHPDNTWNLQKVIGYLKKMYSKENIHDNIADIVSGTTKYYNSFILSILLMSIINIF